MKKICILVSSLVMMTISFSNNLKAEDEKGPISVEFPENEVLMHCVCKHGACHSGNIISFRDRCATSQGGPLNCSEYNSNCK